MRFDLTEDQRLARDVTRAFLAADHPLTTARTALESPTGFDAQLWKKAARLGWTSLLVPDQLGGASLSAAPVEDLTIIAAEIGRAVAPGPFLETNLLIDALVRAEQPALSQRYLPGLLEGATVGSWVAPTDRIQVRVLDDGDVTLQGSATVVMADAESVLLVSHPAATCVCDAAVAGVSHHRLQWLDSTTRHVALTFDNVRLPAEQILATGAEEVERHRQLAWVLQAAELTGVLDAVFTLTSRWLTDRFSFGRPLASYQAIKHRCADMKMWLEATHGVADAAASAIGTPEAALLTRAAKAYAATRALDLLQDCVQLHGGIGVTWEHDLHLYLRRATMIAHSYSAPAQMYDEVAGLELEAVVA